MKKHLSTWHPDLYAEYLQAALELTKSKKEIIKKTKELEQMAEQETGELEALGGPVRHVSAKKPKTATLEQFWGKSVPVKYPKNSDFQRRAELDMAAYICTANLSFQHIESNAFQR